jgi:hypothetical protein
VVNVNPIGAASAICLTACLERELRKSAPFLKGLHVAFVSRHIAFLHTPDQGGLVRVSVGLCDKIHPAESSLDSGATKLLGQTAGGALARCRRSSGS